MAMTNQTDPGKAQHALSVWLSERVGHAEVSNVHIPASNGLSNETVLFHATWAGPDTGDQRRERLVARVAPAGPALSPTYDLDREARVMRALSAAGVPVPTVLFEEPDPAVLGGPFLVMPFVPGQVPPDDPPYTTQGWVIHLNDTERATLHHNALITLAQVHALDWRGAGLAHLLRPELADSALDQQLTHWRSIYSWAAEDDTNPTIAGAFDWMRHHKPTINDDDLVLNWGDPRIGNMIFSEDLGVAAALDWEFAEIGAPAMDLGWWLVTDRFHSEAIGVPRPAGFPDQDTTIQRYHDLTGRTVEHLDFFIVFAATRLAILVHRTANLMAGAGVIAADSTMRYTNPATQMLAAMLGLAAPDGTPQNYFGNR